MREAAEREREHDRCGEDEDRRNAGRETMRIRMPGDVLAPRVDRLAVETEEALEEEREPCERNGYRSETTEQAGRECTPQPEAHNHHEAPCQVYTDLVVHPRLRSCLRAEIADRVIRAAERVRLRQVPEKKRGTVRDWCENSADGD